MCMKVAGIKWEGIGRENISFFVSYMGASETRGQGGS